jgi:putative ABC transport system permease protein
MSIFQHLLEALASVASNKLRSGLTILGVVIGVAAVISMMAIGNGAQASITSSISSMGTNLLFISSGVRPTAGKTSTVTNPKLLTMADATAIQSSGEAADVKAVAATVTTRGTVTYSSNTTDTEIMGVTANYTDLRALTLSEGAAITEAQVSAKSSVAVIGADVATTLFGDTSGVTGLTIRILGQPFKVVGVLTAKGGGTLGSQDDMILVPISTAETRLSQYRRTANAVDQVIVQANSASTVTAASAEVTALLETRHKVTTADFTITNEADLLSTASSITGTLTMFLGGVGGISLLVGGIGIMNIMLVSVTERTREIGLRKALGARKADIRIQFLLESAVLSVTGGIIGIAVAWGIASLVAKIAASSSTTINPVIDLNSVLLATLFSAAVGLFFGFYPSNHAANLEPVEALRSE